MSANCDPMSFVAVEFFLQEFFMSTSLCPHLKETTMPRGDKSKYTDKQQRKAEHIEESYRKKGVDTDTAAARAWATVNAQDGGGKKPGGSGRKKARTGKPSSKSTSSKPKK